MARKTAAETAKKVVQRTTKKNSESVTEKIEKKRKIKIPAVEKGQNVTVTTDEGIYDATVIAVHGGNRIDAVVRMQEPTTIGTIPHESLTQKTPYWELND